MKAQRVLVTGSSGFIGTHLVKHLQTQGYSVLGLDIVNPIPELQSIHHSCDLLDSERLANLLQDLAPDAIVHLAARTDLGGTEVEDYPANSKGVANLSKAIQGTSSIQRCLFTSSQLVCRVGYIPINDHDYCPPNPYGESKVATENEVRLSHGGGKTWCLFRPTTIWGSGMNSHYASFFNHLRSGRYFHPGTKDLFKSYGYVGNTVYQIEKFLLAPDEAIHQKVFYLADYAPLSLPRWINAIASGLGKHPPPSIPLGICRGLAKIGDLFQTANLERYFPFNSFRLNNILTEYTYDMSTTESVCGPLPFGFEEGVANLVDWIKNNNQLSNNRK